MFRLLHRSAFAKALSRNAIVASAAFAATFAATIAGGCGQAETDEPDCVGSKCDDVSDGNDRAEARLCAGIRGNGQLITAHFASLARITEHYGVIDAAAGGSSASITIFMAESMRMNPAVTDCGDDRCDDAERAARAALLLKSFPGYLVHLGQTEEAAALMQVQAVLTQVQTQGIEDLAAEDAAAAASALESLLTSSDLRELVNPEIIALLQNSPTPEFHVNDILTGIKKLGAFEANDDIIFIRPGVLDFAALADKLGRAASFYAGYGPADQPAMDNFMNDCASPGVGKSWFEVAAMPSGETTCGAVFDDMLGAYRATLLADEKSFRSRADDPVGMVMPALVSTSVLTGDSIAEFASARAAYANGTPRALDIDFDDIKFGYWGAQSDLDRVAENRNGYDDLKTDKFHSLGPATWREALSFSPAEPGLARALELPNGEVSAGGWSDLHPTLALANLGCEEVVYVTRTGDESGFATGVAELLGMSSAQSAQLYDLDTDSAYSLSIAESDATWCTNWNEMSATDLPGISADGYNAPMESSSEFFTAGARPYHNTERSIGLRGCTPGAAR